MTSSNNAAAQIRSGLTIILTALATLVVALLVVPAAYADHLPEGITIDPSPALGVPDPVVSAGANLGPLNLGPLPGALYLPDLIPIMPTQSALSAGVPAIFIDAYTIPGQILYRFDGVLGNIGGAMELYCENCNLSSQTLYQVVWAGGRPPGSQNPLAAPVGAELRNLTVKGAFEVYSPVTGHVHWHYDTAALYDILVPGAPTRRTAKIGFCMYDTYDTFSNINYYPSASAFGWCRSGSPNAQIVRMGISPGIGDYYSAQLADQWINVTGLDAGTYTLRAEINPQRYLDESDFSNNVSTEPRMIPGATATALSVAIAPSATTTLGLSGAIVAPELFARLGAHCQVWSASCYIDGTGKTFVNAGDGIGKLAFQIVTPPQNGTLANSGNPTLTGNTTATIGYTATPGFIGVDTFTYRTIDERNLASNPTTVTIAIGSAPTNTAPPAVSGATTIGEALTATPGSWTGDATITHTYQWQRCNAAGSSCGDVPGSTGVTHTVSTADVGSTLRVVATASNPVGSASAASPVSAAVTALPLVKTPKTKIVRTLILGTRLADFLPGTRQAELFRGFGGPDLVAAKGGADLAYGGRGRDTLQLGNGADIGYGGKGRDALQLGRGADTGYGGRGSDLIIGGKGPDKLFGGNGNDRFKTRDGSIDVVNCGNGIDVVIADAIDEIHKNCETVEFPGGKTLASQSTDNG